MNMLKTLWIKILALFGRKTITTDSQYASNSFYEDSYEDIRKINFNAIFSNKIANYVCNESTISIDEEDKRSKLLSQTIKLINRKKKKIVNRVLGTGGVVLVPYVYGKDVLYKVVPQFRLSINEKHGDKITSATLLADVKTIRSGYTSKTYYRWQDEEIKNGNIYFTQRYTNENGASVDKPDVFADIKDELMIPNVDRCLFAYIKSPVDNRKAQDEYGVPITYGCGSTIAEIYECLEQIRKEFKNKEAFIGVDESLFKKDANGNPILPDSNIYRKFIADGEDFWELFDPAIRDSSYYARLQELYERLEKEVGTSRGILSKVETTNATATEIRKALYDTFTIVGDMRDQFALGMEDFVYACNVIANYYGLTPMGETTLNFDWSFDLLENTQETFSQLMQGYQQGVVDDVELRQFIFPGESIEDAQKKIEEIKAKNPTMDQLLGTNNE